MARKQEFDPLGGFVGGGPARKSRRDKKSYDVLGSGKYGDSGSIFDEGSYEPADVTGYSDALLATGSSRDEPKEEKHGFFSGLFKKKAKQPAQKQAPAPEPVHDPGFDSRDYGIEIKDGVMETGIIKRYQEETPEPVIDEKPLPRDPEYYKPMTLPENQPESDFVEVSDTEADLFGDEEPASSTEEDLFGEEEPAANPAPAAEHEEELFSEVAGPEPKPSAPVSLNPHVCHLCGRTSKEEWPEFGFSEDEFVPLCKTCTKAVTTLLKHADPAEEEEIISEWGMICPGLDERRAKELVAKGRKML